MFSYRITPAYAGNTNRMIKETIRTEDHPRIRGEHFNAPCHAATEVGSPPHTRGTREKREEDIEQVGITPAYAGNTPDFPADGKRFGDHPRIRGEHSKKIP